MKKILIYLISSFLLVGVSICGTYIYLFHNSKYYDLIKYEEKLLDIKMESYIDDVDGYIILDKSEYAVVKLKAKKDCEDELLKLFDEEFGVHISPQSPPLKYPNSSLEYELNTKKPEYMYELLLPGTHGQVTRDVRIFIVEDKDGFMYIYFLG